MAKMSSSPEQTPFTDRDLRTGATTCDSSAADAAKFLQQDIIKLTASNFETAMKELQKITSARTIPALEAPFTIGTAKTRHVESCLQEVAGAIPLANAQLEKTVQNLVAFLVHGSSEIAMRASSCINDARQATQTIIEAACHHRDAQRSTLGAHTRFLLLPAQPEELLPSLRITNRAGEPKQSDLVFAQADYSRIKGM